MLLAPFLVIDCCLLKMNPSKEKTKGPPFRDDYLINDLIRISENSPGFNSTFIILSFTSKV